MAEPSPPKLELTPKKRQMKLEHNGQPIPLYKLSMERMQPTSVRTTWRGVVEGPQKPFRIAQSPD